MTERSSDPGSVKSPELDIGHLSAGHHKLAVPTARHVADNRNVVGLVGQYQSRLVIRHENVETAGVGRIAAKDAMLTHDKDIARLRDRLCIRRRLQWAGFQAG